MDFLRFTLRFELASVGVGCVAQPVHRLREQYLPGQRAAGKTPQADGRLADSGLRSAEYADLETIR